MERARRRKREQEEREARLRSHYVSDSQERVQAEVAALVGLGGEDLARRGEAAAALAQVTTLTCPAPQFLLHSSFLVPLGDSNIPLGTQRWLYPGPKSASTAK